MRSAVVALVLALTAIGVAPAVSPVSAASCSGWSSTSSPPPSIRVYRVSEGKIDRVDFRLYVERVMTKEWGPHLPVALQRAGAVAVKQYAWKKVINWRGGTFNGRCYDVKDTTADQLYHPTIASSTTRQVVGETWSWTVWRDGKFIVTGYRRGQKVPCARDAGVRLYARSARRCANSGWSAKRILQVYYAARVKGA